MTDIEQRILREYYRQSLSKSYEEISLKSICQELSISTGHLSYYFPKKELLLARMLELAVRKFKRILKEQLEFVEENSLPFYLAIEYYIFFVSCERDEFRRTYVSVQKLPDVIIRESSVLTDSYIEMFKHIGLPITEDRFLIAHTNLYFLLTNSYKLLLEGEISLKEEEILETGIRTFLWMCGIDEAAIEKYVDQMYKIVRLIDKDSVFNRAIEMEEMDYNEI